MRQIKCGVGVLGFFVFVGFAAIFVAPASVWAEDSCIKHEAHTKTVFFLVDRSGKLADNSGLKQTIGAVNEMVHPGERLVIGVSTGSLSGTRLLFDLVRPATSMWESVMKTRAKEKAFHGCFSSVEASLLQQNEEHKQSAIAETLSFVSTLLSGDAATAKQLVIYSDMVENSAAITFVGTKAVEPAAAIAKSEKDGLIAKLSGVEVFVSGAGIGVPDERARKIEQFWRLFFEKAGASLKYYGPIFVGM